MTTLGLHTLVSVCNPAAGDQGHDVRCTDHMNVKLYRSVHLWVRSGRFFWMQSVNITYPRNK